MRVEIVVDVSTPGDLDEAAAKLHRAADELARAAGEARRRLDRALQWNPPRKSKA